MLNNNMYLMVLNGAQQLIIVIDPNSHQQYPLISTPSTYNYDSFALQNNATNHNPIHINQSNINVINYQHNNIPTNQHLPKLGNISSTLITPLSSNCYPLQHNNNNNNNNNNINQYISHNQPNGLGNIPITTPTFNPSHNESVHHEPLNNGNTKHATNEQSATLRVTMNNNTLRDSDGNKTNNIHDTATNKILECSYCRKRFTKRWNLKEHIKVHTKEKPFRCNICSKGFSQKHSLKDHLRIHSGEKPFECDVCYKRFRIKYNMTVHRRIHTGERPYSCKFCEDKRFTSKAGLNSHLTTHKK